MEVAALAAAAICVIASQVKGQSLQGKRPVLQPAVLIVMGVTGLAGMSGVRAADVACIAASALVAGDRPRPGRDDAS